MVPSGLSHLYTAALNESGIIESMAITKRIVTSVFSVRHHHSFDDHQTLPMPVILS